MNASALEKKSAAANPYQIIIEIYFTAVGKTILTKKPPGFRWSYHIYFY